MENDTFSIYDNVDAKRKQKSVRLTPFQVRKLEHICQLFGITYQRLFVDFVDYFYMDIIDVQSGRISINQALKQTTLDLLDDYIKLKEAKGLVPAPFYLKRNKGRV